MGLTDLANPAEPLENLSRWLFQSLDTLGIELPALSQALGLSFPPDRPTPALRTIDEYFDVLEYCAHSRNDATFGITLAQNLQMADLGVLGYLIKNSQTVASRVEVIMKYHSLMSNSFHHSFTTENDMAIWQYQTAQPNREGYRLDVEYTLAAVILYSKTALGADWTPQQSYFSFPAPQAQQNLPSGFWQPLDL